MIYKTSTGDYHDMNGGGVPVVRIITAPIPPQIAAALRAPTAYFALTFMHANGAALHVEPFSTEEACQKAVQELSEAYFQRMPDVYASKAEPPTDLLIAKTVSPFPGRQGN